MRPRALARLLVFVLFAASPPAHAKVAGTVKCQAAKVLAAGKKAAAKAACYQKALLKGVAVDPSCLEKAEAKFAKAIAKADGFGACAGTAADLEADVDACVATLVGAATAPPATPTPTPGATPTPTPTPASACSIAVCTVDADCGAPACGPCTGSLCLGFGS